MKKEIYLLNLQENFIWLKKRLKVNKISNSVKAEI